MLQDLIAIIRRIVDPLLEGRTPFLATVISQTGGEGGTLDLRPISPSTFGDLSGVPLLVTPPGIKIAVVPGAVVRVEFLNGDKRSPVATLLSLGQAKSMTINATTTINLAGGGGPAISRVGDLAGQLVWDATITTLYYAPGNSPTAVYTPVVGPMVPGTPPAPGYPGTPITLATGSSKVFSG